MASPSTPMHGMHAAVWRHRPQGFVGQGLNDAVWVTSGYSGADSTYLEVVIDSELGGGGGVDTFKWRADGGAWTENVDITGAAQEIADGITIAFTATTGHTLTDSWSIGWLDGEACTESTNEAQITTAANRILDPNNLAAFTDAGGETTLIIHPANGWAKFTDNVGEVTVDGEYVPAAALEKVGYLRSWSLNVNLDMADASRCGQKWKEGLPGMASFSGSAESFFIGCDTFWDAFEDGVTKVQDHFLLKLFNYDPDQDQTGDHFICWVTLTGISIGAPINALVNEPVTFTGELAPAFVANS